MNLRHLELSFRCKHLSTSYSPAYKRRICPRSHHTQSWWGGTNVWDINRSFNQLRLLAALGILPRNLLKVKPPKCAVCLYGAMKNPPWCTKYADNRNSIRKDSAPGECILVDHMEYSTPGFISQLKGKKPSTVTVQKKSFWITTVIWPTCTCREDCCQTRRYKRRKRLRIIPGSTR